MQNKHNTHEEEKSAVRNDKAPSTHFTVNKPRISLFGLDDVLLCAFCTIILVKMLRETVLNILRLNILNFKIIISIK